MAITTIKIHKETVNALRENKPAGVTYDYFLKELLKQWKKGD